MAKSTRFPVAVHILTGLAVFEGKYVSSEMMGKSVDTNPVAIRKILASLIEAGWIETQAGSQGGAKLVADPASISLLDVYRLVEDPVVFKMHEPQKRCPIAVVLKDEMSKVIDDSEAAMEKVLGKTTIADVSRKAKRRWNQSTKAAI